MKSKKKKIEKYKLKNNLIRKGEEINTNLNDRNIINLDNEMNIDEK